MDAKTSLINKGKIQFSDNTLCYAVYKKDKEPWFLSPFSHHMKKYFHILIAE